MPKRFYNMDIMRYLLAFIVIVAHFSTLTGKYIWLPISPQIAVGGFFAISGFLMYPAFKKAKNAKEYIVKRAWRILPPYCLIVVLAALLLVACSTLTAGQYFSNPQLYKYLAANLAFLNFLEPCLPETFSGDNFILHAVNGSLWTMKVEWMLYLSVPAAVWISSTIKKKQAVFISVIILSVIYRVYFYELYNTTGKESYNILGRQVLGQLYYFYTGVLVYLNYNRFTKHWKTISIIASTVILLQEFIPYGYITTSQLAWALLILTASLIGDWGKKFTHNDNVSYDIYLSHFPIIQVGIFFGINSLPTSIGLIVTTIATVLFSIFSYKIVWKFKKTYKNFHNSK